MEIAREGAAPGRPRIATAFFGGGTPSLLEPDEIAALGEAIRASFDFVPDEVTFEANPATLDRARLRAWRALGATRVSLGAQSFSARALAALGRTHTPADIAPAVSAARSVGLDVNLDLIFGRPGEPEGEWRADLDAALALAPDHISAYPLELALEPEEGAANWGGGGWPTVARWRTAARASQPDDDGQADRYELASALLRSAGYRHYEIANWAKPGKECRHNLVYWRNGEWLGVGAGAHSHLAGQRSRQPGAIRTYVQRAERGEPAIPDGGADAVDSAILALRLDEGLDLAAYGAGFDVPLVALSGHAADEDRKLGLESGFDNYLTKPIKASDLLAEVRFQGARPRPVTARPGATVPAVVETPAEPASASVDAAGPRRRGVLGGLVVIALGVPFILQPLGVPNAASYLFIAMGLAFLISYLRGRQYVYLIPMVTLISFGVALLLPTWITIRSESAAPAFVGIIATGFVVAFALAPRHRWPLVPAVLLGIAAAARFVTGASLIPAPLEPFLVPVVLIGVGAYLLAEPRT